MAARINKKPREYWRDRLRGWSEADLASLDAKMTGPEAIRPNGIIMLTQGEMNAMRARQERSRASPPFPRGVAVGRF